MSTDELTRRIASLAEKLPLADLELFAEKLAASAGPDDGTTQAAVLAVPHGPRKRAAAVVAAWRIADVETPGSGIALALRGAGRAVEAHRRARASVVWTGPDSPSDARGTAGTVIELVAGAEKRLLLLSFATYRLPTLDAELRKAAERGVVITIVLETVEDSGEKLSFDLAQHYAVMPNVRLLRWPRDRRPPGASLHAKAVVADGRRAFVTSANLTGKALEANIELGVLVEDRVVAESIERHVKGLVVHGEFVPSTS